MKRDERLVWLAAASVAFLAIGCFVSGRVVPEKYGDAPMAEYYLSMACRCAWPNGNTAWSIHTVPAPFRWRVLVPWIAGALPFPTVTSLALVTYASLVGYYFLLLLWCRRISVSPPVAVVAIAVPFAFEPHLINYFHPYLAEGFSLFLMAVMVYAFTIDSFVVFAIAGFAGVFAREVIWALLPVWCARDIKKGLALTAVATAAIAIEHSVIWGPPYARPYTIDPMTVLRFHVDNVGNYVRDIRATWGWAFGVSILGLLLLPAAVFRIVWPVALGLAVAAFGSSLFATDTARLFGVMMPIVVIAAAQVLLLLIAQRRYALVATLVVLTFLQYCVTPINAFSIDSAAVASATNPIRLGLIWTVATALALRETLAERLREKCPFITWPASDAR